MDQGRRAECRTHLEFLLGYKVLHTPDDLDGGPVVLPQPAVEKGGEEGGHPVPAAVRGLQAARVSPGTRLGPSRSKHFLRVNQGGKEAQRAVGYVCIRRAGADPASPFT